MTTHKKHYIVLSVDELKKMLKEARDNFGMRSFSFWEVKGFKGQLENENRHAITLLVDKYKNKFKRAKND